MDLSYDLMLGKPWLTKMNPDINWTTNQVKFRHKSRIHYWRASERVRAHEGEIPVSPPKLCSVNEFHKECCGKGAKFVVWVNTVEQAQKAAQSTDPQVRELLLKYKGVFEPVVGLPNSTHGVTHAIPLMNETGMPPS